MVSSKLLVAAGLVWLWFALGVAVLVVYRRRAPRAVGFALVVYTLMTLYAAYVPLRYVVKLPPGQSMFWTQYWGQAVVSLGVWLLLPVAAMMERRPGSPR